MRDALSINIMQYQCCSFLDCIFSDCASCTANDFNCTWCVDTCHSSSHICSANGEFDDVFNFTTKASTEEKAQAIAPGKLTMKDGWMNRKESLCDGKMLKLSPNCLYTAVCDGELREATSKYCDNFHNCLACAAETHCMWQQATGKIRWRFSTLVYD